MSEIKVDNLNGKTSAGDITVTSEGGAATMQLQQGLAKAWVNFDGTGTVAVRDSANITSLLDNGTGDYTISYASSLANDDYSISGISANMGSSISQIWIANSTYVAAGSFRMTTLYVSNTTGGGTNADQTFVSMQIMGDLS
mgnify:CR=1 FL=1|tara:strand:+ start:786 stop:1208 length:423 start_codon:yes stop_codon:yes gene_type:complete